MTTRAYGYDGRGDFVADADGRLARPAVEAAAVIEAALKLRKNIDGDEMQGYREWRAFCKTIDAYLAKRSRT